MNRKQFLIAVFTALIGAKRWRKLFPPKRTMIISPSFANYMTSDLGSLFNPTANVVSQWRNAPLPLHPACFTMTFPKIGDTLNVRTPARWKVSAVNVAA